MCGICGFRGIGDSTILDSMSECIVHRGPNSFGSHIDSNIGLACRRLSVIDVEGGNQPIHNEDESIWVVQNGEIYNFKSLRKTLESKGHRFSTNSDTETIVHAYEEWKEECVKHLNGMFAFAIWDNTNKKLFIARDRVGKKPLYYSWFGDVFLFGSEIKSILQFPEFKREINNTALHYFLSLRYNPSSQTLFENVKKLPPGHFLSLDKNGFRIEKYWDIQFDESSDYDESYYTENIRSLLNESVNSRLISDVPLGAFLSGGVDSSTVVGIMSQLLEQPVKTFSIGFEEEEFNELPFAKQAAEYFGTDHHEFYLPANSFKLLPEIIWHFDEPVADPAAIPTYVLSEQTKKYCTVVLTGEGGDELFGGYEHYKIMKTAQKMKKLGKVGSKLLTGILKTIPKKNLDYFFKYASSLGPKGIERVEFFLKNLDNPIKSYLDIVSIFLSKEIASCYPQAKLNDSEAMVTYLKKNFIPKKNQDIVSFIQNVEFKTSLPENLLMKVDKMTMAHSLEGRVPLLDYKLVELCSKMPTELKIKKGTEKYILRKIAQQIVPKTILDRPKQRFFVPIHHWIKNENKDMVEQILDRSIKNGNMSLEYHKKLQHYLIDSPLYASRQIWNLITLELWREIFIESDTIQKRKPDLFS